MLIGFEHLREKETQRKAQTKKKDAFEYLLEKDPELALDQAIKTQSAQRLRQALAAGASIETASRSGLTRMHQAAKNGRLEEVRFLQQMGANVNALSKTKETPLLFALQYDHGAIIEFLAACPECDPTLKTKKHISPLKFVLENDNIKHVIVLMKNAKVKAGSFVDAFKKFIQTNKRAKAKAMLDCQQWLEKLSQEECRDLLDDAIAQKAGFALIQKLFYCQKSLFDIPFSKLISNLEHFDTKEKMQEFLALDEPLSYLESHQLVSKVAISALTLLQLHENVKGLDKILDEYGEDENAMGDKKVKHANRHFKDVVGPYLQEAFLSYSKKADKTQALIGVEQHIREIILDVILQKAIDVNEKETINFIKKNKNNLILGRPKTMEASVEVFKALTPEQAAWRGYNPFAAVSGEWDNLLTPTDTDDIWKTNAASEAEKLTGEIASTTVRERVAYYFQAVIEGDDEALKRNRLVNFINILAEIRNAKGLDNPSCYPGTLTRVAQMGAFHDIAQLPPTFEDKLAEVMKTKVLALFKEKFSALATIKEKRDLLDALIGLTHKNARDVIKDQSTFAAPLLNLRQAFIEELGSPMAIFNEVKESLDYETEAEELICVNQALLDPVRGDIGLVLEEYFNKQLDTIPTNEEKANANPFEKEKGKVYQVTALILESIEQHLAHYFQSTRKLQSLTSFIVFKVPAIMQNGLEAPGLSNFFEALDGPVEAIHRAHQQCLAQCQTNGLLEEKAELQNPYVATTKLLEGQLKNMLQPSPLKSMLEARLLKAQNKQELFTKYLTRLEQSIQQAGKKLEEASSFLEALAEHVFEHNEVKMAELEKALNLPSHLDFLRCDSVQEALNPVLARTIRAR